MPFASETAGRFKIVKLPLVFRIQLVTLALRSVLNPTI